MKFSQTPVIRIVAYDSWKASSTPLKVRTVVFTSMSEQDEWTRLPVKRETREEIVKPMKRGGETYDALIRRAFEGFGERASAPENPPEIH